MVPARLTQLSTNSSPQPRQVKRGGQLATPKWDLNSTNSVAGIYPAPVSVKPGAGFTLIELLIVMAVLGVLISIVMMAINPFEQFAKARDAQRKSDLSNIQKALELYYNDNNSYPATNAFPAPGTQWADYMQKVPGDPITNRFYRYQQELSGQGYRLYSSLERCRTGTGNCYDPQACGYSNGTAIVCPKANPTDCGQGQGQGQGNIPQCMYGVASSNLSP